jgi:hypothetical protein
MVWFLLLCGVVPALACAALIALLPGGPSHPRREAALDRARTRAAGLAEHAAARLRRTPTVPPLPDPFDALHVQTRLTIVAEHLRRLEADTHAWARAERIIASQLAYDALLAQACRMAGVEVLPRAKGDPWERLREEVELTARGWTW